MGSDEGKGYTRAWKRNNRDRMKFTKEELYKDLDSVKNEGDDALRALARARLEGNAIDIIRGLLDEIRMLGRQAEIHKYNDQGRSF